MTTPDETPVETDRPSAFDDSSDIWQPDPTELPENSRTKELTKRSWFYVLRKTFREFLDDQCTDAAAALTYYSVLAVFPALLALLSLLSVVGQGDKSVQTILDILAPLVSSNTIDNDIAPTLHTLANSQGASVTLLVGILGALWSASGYVGAFSRAMNKIYEVEEGRPFWKLRPIMLLVTVASIVLCAIALVILVVSGPVADSIGKQIGAGDTLQQVWNIAKWPALAIVVMMIVALLYWATPNVKQAKFRWLSIGSFVAILIWLIASTGFAFYVINFSSYNKTYGSVAGVVVALLWLWLTNNALLFGAELDAELERARELQAGVAAEETIQLPVRDSKGIEKSHRRRAKDVESGRQIRESVFGPGDPLDRPFGKKSR
jgi:membrane protein